MVNGRFSFGFFLFFMTAHLSGCATAVAVLDTAGSAVIYTGKTIVNTVDAITPDIVND